MAKHIVERTCECVTLLLLLLLTRYKDEVGIEIVPFKKLVYLPDTDTYVPCMLSTLCLLHLARTHLTHNV